MNVMMILVESMVPVSIKYQDISVNVMSGMNSMVQPVRTKTNVCTKHVKMESASIQTGAISVSVMMDTVLHLMEHARIQMNVKL